MTDWSIRDDRPEDEPSWLRCRALAFLSTDYYDDVKRVRTALAPGAVALVAVRPRPDEVRTPGADQVVGVLDVEVWDDDGVRRATIDTVAVHPDHRRQGIADALLTAALPRLRAAGASTLDAWTREDEAANAWYRAQGMGVETEYLHVHKSGVDPDDGFTSPAPLSAPVTAFAHARLADAEQVRARFGRVHVCRRYLRTLTD